MESDKKLNNHVSVVFGGNGDIGGAIALGLSFAGATVIPVGRNLKRLKSVSAKLDKLGNASDDYFSVDITQQEQVNKCLGLIKKKYKKIDSMICACGIYLNAPAEKTTDKQWNKVINTNLSANFFVSQSVGKIMIKQGFGSIVTIGSLGSFVALSGTVAYSVSKAGVVSMTQCLASEWADKGVRVNCIVPGVFPTKLNKQALARSGRLDNILKGIPAKRLGKLEELVGAAVFLVSNDSKYVNGVSLPVDGGFLAFSGY